MLQKPSRATITWSEMVMSMYSAARSSLRVNRRSSGLGSGSPLGWLCTTIMHGVFAMMAGRRISEPRVEAVLTVPW